MIPRAEVELDSTVPDAYRFWTPTREDISEEGFAYFRDTGELSLGLSSRERADVYRHRQLTPSAGGR